LPLLFNFTLEYAIRKVKEKEVSLELNGTHELLVYADDINLLGDSINTIKENAEVFLGANRDVGIEIHTEKMKYVIVSCHQNLGQNQYMRITKESFENVSKLRILRDDTNQNDVHEEIKNRLNSGNACYHSVHNLLSFCLIPKKAKY
jgi:hypothetical protein